jgi:hypothetical protein
VVGADVPPVEVVDEAKPRRLMDDLWTPFPLSKMRGFCLPGKLPQLVREIREGVRAGTLTVTIQRMDTEGIPTSYVMIDRQREG